MKEANLLKLLETLAEDIQRKENTIRWQEYEIERLEKALKEAKSHE